jgi:cathepsin L
MRKYHKSYGHDEFQYRYSVFKKNLDFITQHAQTQHTYTVKMNKFGDLTNLEFSKIFLGFRGPSYSPKFEPTVPGAYPDSLDWNAKGYVTPIKNQGQCGSCWSFSTTGSMEGCHMKTTGQLVSLSEQNLMDCSTPQGNQGCNGGLMTAAFAYIMTNGGIDTEASYPYTAMDGTCQFSTANIGSLLSIYENVTSGSEADLQAKVNVGPTSVAMDASQDSFQFYSSGIYSDPACSSVNLDHGVLATGWGVDNTGADYWIVKNSWGTDWGLDGFFWMARNDNNMCGIATMASLPETCDS